MSYQVATTQFTGPFDLLLQLIEEHELDITSIALADITEEFIQRLQQVEERQPEELADFLVIAAKLLYIKSRALLPYLEAPDDEPASQLAAQLRMYKEFRAAADALTERMAERNFSIARSVTTERLTIVEFSPAENVTPSILSQVFAAVLDRVETVIRIPQAAIRKAITLKDKIIALNKALEQHKQIRFSEITDIKHDKMDLVMTFLAILEMVRQDVVSVQQTSYYSDITINRIEFA